MRVRLLMTTLSVLAAVQFAAVGPALADDLPLLVADKNEVTLTDAKDGTRTAKVTFANTTSTDMPITVEGGADGPANCKIKPDPAAVSAHRQQSVTLTFTTACAQTDKSFTFTVTVASQTFKLVANPPATPSPDWTLLWWFVGALFVAAVTAGVTFYYWQKADSSRQYWMELPGLLPTWSFKDSWASNATVVAALFAGLFGATDVTTSLLGDDAKAVLALVGVAVALAVGMAGLSPMVLQTLRRAGHVTPLGLLAASVFTLTATAGELAVIVIGLEHTAVGRGWWLDGLGAAAGALLLGYAVTSTLQNLTAGEHVQRQAVVPKLVTVDEFAHADLRDDYKVFTDKLTEQNLAADQAHGLLFPTATTVNEIEADRPAAIL